MTRFAGNALTVWIVWTQWRIVKRQRRYRRLAQRIQNVREWLGADSEQVTYMRVVYEWRPA